MENVLAKLQDHKTALLSEYPRMTELTHEIFSQYAEMLQTDFDAVSRSSKRLMIVRSCVADALDGAFQHNVKKGYAVKLLEPFLDAQIEGYLMRKLGDGAGDFLWAVRSAKSRLIHSQWSDTSSKHWQRALRCIRP